MKEHRGLQQFHITSLKREITAVSNVAEKINPVGMSQVEKEYLSNQLSSIETSLEDSLREINHIRRLLNLK